MIEHHPTYDLYDSTKIKCYMDCPRKYFYEYILGWQPKTPSLHLEFGVAWHLAMEHLLLSHDREGTYSDKAILKAFELFYDHYRKFFPPEMDADNSPKNPDNALRALTQYADLYNSIDQFSVLYTEIAGTVPILNDLRLNFRLDSILQTPFGIKSREHKTGSTLSRQWVDQWSLSVQTGTYLHVLHCLYREDEVWGVDINGTFFQKKENKFQRVPVRRTIPMMNAWLCNVTEWVEAIKFDTMDILLDAQDSLAVMVPFRMNTENCTKYFGCSYHDFCISWPNPLQNIERIPEGMEVRFWNPADTEKAKQVFDLQDEKE